jgi:hypothetical protein
MYKLREFIKSLLVRWELVYSSQEASTHFEKLGRLDNKGIKYKTKTISFGGGYGGGEGFNSIFHIYVPKSAIHKANDAIHHSKF